MAGTQGISNTENVVTLVLKVVGVIEQIKTEGKISVGDFALLMNLIPVVGPGLASLPAVPKELSDLSAEEVASLTAFITSSLGGTDAKALTVITNALAVVAAVVTLIDSTK